MPIEGTQLLSIFGGVLLLFACFVLGVFFLTRCLVGAIRHQTDSMWQNYSALQLKYMALKSPRAAREYEANRQADGARRERLISMLGKNASAAGDLGRARQSLVS